MPYSRALARKRKSSLENRLAQARDNTSVRNRRLETHSMAETGAGSDRATWTPGSLQELLIGQRLGRRLDAPDQSGEHPPRTDLHKSRDPLSREPPDRLCPPDRAPDLLGQSPADLGGGGD